LTPWAANIPHDLVPDIGFRAERYERDLVDVGRNDDATGGERVPNRKDADEGVFPQHLGLDEGALHAGAEQSDVEPAPDERFHDPFRVPRLDVAVCAGAGLQERRNDTLHEPA
jgi:hypothetical protein